MGLGFRSLGSRVDRKVGLGFRSLGSRVDRKVGSELKSQSSELRGLGFRAVRFDGDPKVWVRAQDELVCCSFDILHCRRLYSLCQQHASRFAL